MKYFLLSPDAGARIDPTIQKTLLDFIPGRASTVADADVVFVPISYMADYRFNEELLRIDVNNRIVFFDFLEFGWNAGDKTNVLGTDALTSFDHLSSEEWIRLDLWVKLYKPTLTFKRELFQRDVTERMLPVEFPCRLPIPPIQTEAEFNARPLEVFHNWGLSSPARPRLHGDIFRNAHEHNIHVIDGWKQRPNGARNWMTVHTPHYQRKHIDVVMAWNQRAKLSVSLPGAGIKCFRSTESPVGSIMALHYDDMAWSYPWKDMQNCLRLFPEDEFDCINRALMHASLYPIYVESQRTIEKYRSDVYTRDYITPAILQRL